MKYEIELYVSDWERMLKTIPDKNKLTISRIKRGLKHPFPCIHDGELTGEYYAVVTLTSNDFYIIHSNDHKKECPKEMGRQSSEQRQDERDRKLIAKGIDPKRHNGLQERSEWKYPAYSTEPFPVKETDCSEHKYKHLGIVSLFRRDGMWDGSKGYVVVGQCVHCGKMYEWNSTTASEGICIRADPTTHIAYIEKEDGSPFVNEGVRV
jgi:hypothetical protein